MGKKQKNVNSSKNNNKEKKLEQEKSITSILSEDKNKIADATSKAKNNIDSVAYADNLIPPNKKVKSVRSLNIEDKKENEEQKDVVDNNSNKEISNNTEEIKEKSLETKKISNNEITKISNTTSIEKEKQDKSSTSNKKSYKTLFVVSFAIICIVLLFLIFSTIFALTRGNSSTIINGVRIKDIDISGLSKEEAISKVSEAFKPNMERQITLKHNEYEISVFPEQFNVSFDIEKAVNIAYEKGRSRKYFSK